MDEIVLDKITYANYTPLKEIKNGCVGLPSKVVPEKLEVSVLADIDLYKKINTYFVEGKECEFKINLKEPDGADFSFIGCITSLSIILDKYKHDTLNITAINYDTE